MSAPTRVFRAAGAWDGARLLRDAAIIERDGRIVAALEGAEAAAARGDEACDFGDAILLPGFINAHCHLEYSCLEGRLPEGMPFADWIGAVTRLRHERPEEEFISGAARALEESIRDGTTAILDIFTRGSAETALRASGLRVWAFLEAIRLAPAESEAGYAGLFARLTALETHGRFRPGLSPHTPYTVSAPLMRKIGRLARARGLPLAIHVAETPEERRLLEDGEGPLVELFDRMGFLPPGWAPPGVSPVEWADRQGVVGRDTLVIHANDLTALEIALLAVRGASVAFCPRAHRYFGRPTHPLEKLLDAGVNVCLGTDSLASNDSLDMLAELREAHRMFPDLRATTLFPMVGRNVARFLGMEGRLGSLLPESACDMTAVAPAPPLDGGGEAALRAILQDPRARAVGAVTAGERLAATPARHAP